MSMRNSEDNKRKSVSKGISKALFLIGFSLFIVAGASAQDPGNPGDPQGEVDLPFDGGVSLLVAAGVAYGAKQWHNGRKKENEEEEKTEEL